MKYGADVYKSGWTTIYLGELGGGLLAWCTCCIMLYCRTVKFHFARLASSVFRRLLVAARYFTEHCSRSQFLQELFTSYDLLDLQFPGFLESLLGLLCCSNDYLVAPRYFRVWPISVAALLSIFISPIKSPKSTPSKRNFQQWHQWLLDILIMVIVPIHQWMSPLVNS